MGGCDRVAKYPTIKSLCFTQNWPQEDNLSILNSRGKIWFQYLLCVKDSENELNCKIFIKLTLSGLQK